MSLTGKKNFLVWVGLVLLWGVIAGTLSACGFDVNRDGMKLGTAAVQHGSGLFVYGFIVGICQALAISLVLLIVVVLGFIAAGL